MPETSRQFDSHSRSSTRIRIHSLDFRLGSDEPFPKRSPAFVVKYRVGGVRDRHVYVTDEVIDPVGAVAGWVKHGPNYPIGLQNLLLDQTIQHLLNLRPEANEHGILQFLSVTKFSSRYFLNKGCLVMSGEPR